MKKLIIFIVILSILFLNLSTYIFAQKSSLLLAVTYYKTREDLDVLFNQKERVLGYFEDKDKAFFLSLITNAQKEILVKNNLNPKIIDNDTDILRYVLLVHPNENQSQKLSKLGETFPLSDHYTLLKLNKNESFTIDKAPEFSIVPFPELIVPPPLRTETVITKEISPNITETPLPVKKNTNSLNKKQILIFLPILIIFFLALISLYASHKNKPLKQ